MSNPSASSRLAGAAAITRLRRSLIRLQDETRLLRRDLLRRKYDPSQPRVPAGSSDGGQWTSGAGGGGGSLRPMPGFGPEGGLAEAGPEDGFVVDETGAESWAFYEERRDKEGDVAERAIVNRDGSTIHSEYAASRQAGFDERHTVTTPEGDKVTFETTERTQTIRFGGPGGDIVGRTVWTPGGPEPDAEIVEARWRRDRGSSGSAWSQAGGTLFGWLNALGEATGLSTVLGFRASDYSPGTTGSLEVSFVGQVDRGEVERACPHMPTIQEILDSAARDAGPSSNFESMQRYGTEVHLRLKREIDAWGNPDIVAERSYFKERLVMGEQRYGTAGTARFDVFESVSDGTRCLYDIKTGRGLSRSQSDILADAAMRIEGPVRRLIVIELRPRR